MTVGLLGVTTFPDTLSLPMHWIAMWRNLKPNEPVY